jgi:hypothetical protein
MTLRLTYEAANGEARTVTLQNAEWQKIRGVAVLRGQQKINGRLVNRSIAATEIVNDSIQRLDCADSPDGKHQFAPDLEYDSTGETINCEYCGEPKPDKKRQK